MKIDDITKIELGLINKCVLKCPMCLRQEEDGKKLKKNIFINFNKLTECIDAFSNVKIIDIVGSVSEPTLYPYFFELLFYLKSKNIKLRISTNGSTNIDWKKFGELLDENDIVRFPIEGSTNYLHSKYRVGSSLEKVIKNHNLFKENSKATTIMQSIIFKYNEHDKDNIIKFYNDTLFDLLEFTHTGDSLYIDENIKPVRNLELLYKQNNIKYPEVECNCYAEKFIYINHLGAMLPCDDLEEISFKYENNDIFKTINNNSISECFDQLNEIINKKNNNTICSRVCGKFNKIIRKKYPVIQYNKQLENYILNDYRGVYDGYNRS